MVNLKKNMLELILKLFFDHANLLEEEKNNFQLYLKNLKENLKYF